MATPWSWCGKPAARRLSTSDSVMPLGSRVTFSCPARQRSLGVRQSFVGAIAAWLATLASSARVNGRSAHAPEDALMWPQTVSPKRPPVAGHVEQPVTRTDAEVLVKRGLLPGILRLAERCEVDARRPHPSSTSRHWSGPLPSDTPVTLLAATGLRAASEQGDQLAVQLRHGRSLSGFIRTLRRMRPAARRRRPGDRARRAPAVDAVGREEAAPRPAGAHARRMCALARSTWDSRSRAGK